MTVFDDYADLRGNERDKNLEKIYGPEAKLIVGEDRYEWYVRRCPLCNCVKSFDPDVPNNVLYGCDGECACHDGMAAELRYAS